jgi:hypothetical protein
MVCALAHASALASRFADLARMLIVSGCALALIAAGRALPF